MTDEHFLHNNLNVSDEQSMMNRGQEKNYVKKRRLIHQFDNTDSQNEVHQFATSSRQTRNLQTNMIEHENQSQCYDYGNGSHFCEICHVELPSVQASEHCLSSNHVKCLAAIAKMNAGLMDDEMFCTTCHCTMHKGIGSSHVLNKQHIRKERNLKRFEEWCMTRPAPRGKFHWKKEFPKEDLSAQNHQSVLNQFDSDAAQLFSDCGFFSRSSAAVCKPIEKLIAYLKNDIIDRTGKMIVSDYKKLVESCGFFSSPWVLHHKLQSASDLMTVIKEADEDVLQKDGFWILQDDRRFSREGGGFDNLSKLIERSEYCLLKLDQHKFGFGDLLYEAHNGIVMPQQECSLPEFLTHTLALDKAVQHVMSNLILDSNVQLDLFCEALFNNVPKKFKIFYDRDMDINRFEDLQVLGFGPAASLVDASMSSVTIRGVDVRAGGNTSTYDAYDFPVDCKYEDIMKIDPRVTTGIILNDDGVGACVRKKLDEETYKHKFLRIIVGANQGSIITSMFGSRTSIHVEDAFLGTSNYMLLGAPKIWYMVPKTNADIFRKYLQEKNLLHTVIEKTCFVKAFGDGGFSISSEIMLQCNIHRFVQYPSMTVMSVPGEIYHWTICCGFNIAEARNYFTTAAGDSLTWLESSWRNFTAIGGCQGSESAILTSSLYFKACNEFEVL